MIREAQIYVPSEYEATIGALCKDAIQFFGGATVTRGQGYWKDKTSKLVAEPVSIVTMACEETPQNAITLC